MNRKALTALTMIFSGLLLIQGYWIKRVSVDRDEIHQVVAEANEPTVKVLLQVRDMQEVQHFALISVEQRLRLLEQAYTRVYEVVRDQSNHSAKLKPDIDALNELLTSLFLRKSHPDVPFEHPPDTVDNTDIDEQLLKRFRENRGRTRPYQ